MINERREGMEIDLQKLLLSYLHNWWIIAAFAAVAGILALYITANFITPMYQSKVMIYVNNNRSEQEVDIITSTNLSTSQRLVDTYITIIKSERVLREVAEVSGLSLTPGQIRGYMKAEQVDTTELFTVTVTHPDPEMAALLVNAVAEVAPREIGEIVMGSSTKIIDYGKVPTAPSSPRKGYNTIIGIIDGAAIAIFYITLRFLLDVRIKDEEDLHMLFELPVLAQIPSFVAESSKRRGGYRYGTSAQGYGTAAEKGAEEK